MKISGRKPSIRVRDRYPTGRDDWRSTRLGRAERGSALPPHKVGKPSFFYRRAGSGQQLMEAEIAA
jgi:hypothetical protein